MNRSLAIGIGVLVLVVLGGVVYWYSAAKPATSAPQWKGPMSQETAAKQKASMLAPSVEKVLSSREDILASMAAEPAIIADVAARNQIDKSLSLSDIQKMDAAWQSTWKETGSSDTQSFIKQFMTNDLAQRLLAFQHDHPEFREIFIADAYGLNVGQTDKTSDYYQADEAWWVNGFNGGAGAMLHGAIEFDQSSQTEAISLYVPVVDSSSGKAIGVVKGVVDLSAIGSAL